MADAKVMDRIRKLLKLAKSDNEHEAAVAAERAQAMLAEHELTIAELDVDDTGPTVQPVTMEEFFRSGRTPGWKSQLAFGVAQAFGARAVISPGFGMEVYGTEAAIAVTKATFRYLADTIQRLGAEAVKSYTGWRSPRAYGNAYRLGMALRIVKRLRARRAAALDDAARKVGARPESVALVRVTQEQAVVARVKQVATGSYADPTTTSRDGLRDGYRDGASVGLDPQLRGGAGARSLKGGTP